jgi:hypothetical protein
VADLKVLGEQWKKAYQQFTAADEANRYAATDDPDAVARIAPAYRQVARCWRQLAGHPETPWWAKAAALHAAEMFDHQAESREQLLRPAGHFATTPQMDEAGNAWLALTDEERSEMLRQRRHHRVPDNALPRSESE